MKVSHNLVLLSMINSGTIGHKKQDQGRIVEEQLAPEVSHSYEASMFQD